MHLNLDPDVKRSPKLRFWPRRGSSDYRNCRQNAHDKLIVLTRRRPQLEANGALRPYLPYILNHTCY